MASPYSKIDLYFMSGTGNSFRACCWFADAAVSRGVAARMIPIGTGSVPSSDSLLGIVFPTHGFTAPWPVIRFALTLPRGRGRHAFVVAARAGMKFGRLFLPGLDGTATLVIMVLLALKGYVVRGNRGLDMPSNWFLVHPGFNAANARAIIARTKPGAEDFITRILDEKRRFGSFLSMAAGLLLVPVSLGYLLYGRFMLGKLFFANERCNGCGLCAAHCQHRAIRMLGRKISRPYWTWRCESCMRCMAYCPARAVEASQSLMIIMIAALSAAMPAVLSVSLIHRVPWFREAPILEQSWFFLLSLVLYLAVVFAVYGIFALVVRTRVGNALFAYTTFTRFWKRYHEPETRDIEMTRPR